MSRFSLSAALPILLFVVVFGLMWPGVFGPFLMDDFVHFPKLSWLDDGAEGFLRFVFNNDNGAGRPLAYLSLLIEDNSWPAQPLEYKINNVLFHCLNTLLVFWVVFEVLQAAKTKLPFSNTAIAFIVALIWGVHPIQLSPTMLTIQRMTLLMGTFVLVGLLLYFKSRASLKERPIAAWLGLLIGVPFCTVIAILFKEPGILLPCFILAFEVAIPSQGGVENRAWRHLVWVAGVVPILLLIAYYFISLPKMEQLYFKREFDMHDRLLTQPRVLIDYIKIILLPTLRELGPYQDYYPISRGIFDPVATALSIGLWFVAIGVAIIQRLKGVPGGFSWWTFGVVWFLLGHALESSFVPIEIYFEHRNYIPMLGPILAFIVIFSRVLKDAPRVATVAISIYISLLGFVTYQSAKTWGSEDKLAVFWAEEHALSARAQYSAMKWHLSNGDLKSAEDVVDRHLRVYPDATAFHLLKLIFENCYRMSPVQPEVYRSTMDRIRVGAFDHGSVAVLSMLQKLYEDEKCVFTFDEVKEVVFAYLENPKYGGLATVNAIFKMQLAELYRQEKDFNGMMHYMEAAYKAKPQYTILLSQSFYLADAGLYDHALCHIGRARREQDYNKFSFIFKEKHIDRYERLVYGMARQRGVQLRGDVGLECSGD